MNTSRNQDRLGIKETLLAVAVAICTVASAAVVALSLSAWTEITSLMFAQGTVLVGNPPWWVLVIAMSIIGAESVLLTVRFWRYLVRRYGLAVAPAWVQPAFGALLLMALAYLGFEVFYMLRSALLTEGLLLCVLLVTTSRWLMKRRQTHGQVAP